MDVPGSHHRCCLLAASNEIILGEVMLKMNHVLADPLAARWAHFSRTLYSEAIHRPPPHMAEASLITYAARHPSTQTKAPDRKPASNPITAMQVNSSNSIPIRSVLAFLFGAFIHMRLELEQPRSSYCLAR